MRATIILIRRVMNAFLGDIGNLLVVELGLNATLIKNNEAGCGASY